MPVLPRAARIETVTDDLFGNTIVDPYRWMETDTPEFDAWFQAQNDHARKALAASPGRNELLARLRELNGQTTRVGWAERRGGALFYSKRGPSDQKPKLYVRDADGERLLVDPETFTDSESDPASDSGKTYELDYFRASPSGRYVAFGLSRAGTEDAVLRIIETKTGRILPERLPRATWAFPAWHPDEKAFLYRRGQERQGGASGPTHSGTRIHLHVLGQSEKMDAAVFGAGVSPAIDVAETEWVRPEVAASGPYDFAFAEAAYFVSRRALAGAKTPWRRLFDGEPPRALRVFGDRVYFAKARADGGDALYTVRVADARLGKHREVHGEPGLLIREVCAAKDAVYVLALRDGFARLLRALHTGGPALEVDLPGKGAIQHFFCDASLPGVVFQFTSWTEPTRQFVYDPAHGRLADTEVIPAAGSASSSIVATEVNVPSSGGVLVPLSILHDRSLQRDGRSPTVLETYATYAALSTPAFDPMLLAWLERGGVHAICHARGGGALGEAWHRAGSLENKPNSIVDLIACAEYLIKERYTAPRHLGLDGFSAGAISVAGAIVRRPELFRAATIRSGLLNALRFEQLPIGPSNTYEFGSVATPEGASMLRAIDAYHQVAPGASYPALLFMTAQHDPRVSAWQSAKMVARLLAATASGLPILLRGEMGAGHGALDKSAQEEERADRYTFLLEHLGPMPRAERPLVSPGR